MAELQNVIGYSQNGPFSIDLDCAPKKKTPEIHVFLCHGEGALGLYAAVDTEELPKGSADHDLHSFPLLHV